MTSIKKTLFTILAALLVLLGIISTIPFCWAEYERLHIKRNGEVVAGELVQIKPVEKEAFADIGEVNAPDDSKYALKGGLVTYNVGGREYEIIRKELSPESKIGDSFDVIYLPETPAASIFKDSSFPFGFMFSSLALLLACIACAGIVMGIAWRRPDHEKLDHKKKVTVKFEETAFDP